MNFSIYLKLYSGPPGEFHHFYSYLFLFPRVQLSRKYLLKVAHHLSCSPCSRKHNKQNVGRSGVHALMRFGFQLQYLQFALLLANVSEPIRAAHTPDHLSLSCVLLSDAKPTHIHRYRHLMTFGSKWEESKGVYYDCADDFGIDTHSTIFPTLRRAIYPLLCCALIV